MLALTQNPDGTKKERGKCKPTINITIFPLRKNAQNKLGWTREPIFDSVHHLFHPYRSWCSSILRAFTEYFERVTYFLHLKKRKTLTTGKEPNSSHVSKKLRKIICTIVWKLTIPFLWPHLTISLDSMFISTRAEKLTIIHLSKASAG